MIRPKTEDSPIKFLNDLINFNNQQEAYIDFLEKKLKEKPVAPEGLGRHHWGSLNYMGRYYAYNGAFPNSKATEMDQYNKPYKHLSDAERSYIDNKYLEIVQQNHKDFKHWQMRKKWYE